MKIVATSDLHGSLPKIPECDLLILGGDYLASGSLQGQAREIDGFVDWLQKVPAREIVGIAGNHDWFLEDRVRGQLGALPWHYLQDEGIELFGLHIYGSPWTPPFYNWAFMQEESTLEKTFSQIPKGLDILVTHGPPKWILDQNQNGEHCGSTALCARVNIVQPRLHIFGHLHEAYGQFTGPITDTRYMNVSLNNVQYQPSNPPIIFDGYYF